jgi:hypothetical protein
MGGLYAANTVRIRGKDIALAPPPPNSGGREPKTRVIPPQNWGVRGASAGMNKLNQTVLVRCDRLSFRILHSEAFYYF